eukprot:g926.t1
MENIVNDNSDAIRSYGFGVGLSENKALPLISEEAALLAMRELFSVTKTLSSPAHFCSVGASARHEAQLDKALSDVYEGSSDVFWRIACDPLHPLPSTKAPDSVPFTFRGGTRVLSGVGDVNMFEDPSSLLSSLENALNGCIHLETIALDAMDSRGSSGEQTEAVSAAKSQRTGDDENEDASKKKLVIPDELTERRSIAWGHALGQNIMHLGSSVEWSYVKRNQMEPLLSNALDILKASPSQATRDWAMLYKSRVAALDIAVSAYMIFRDRAFAADTMDRLRDRCVECGLASLKECETLEEASLRLLLAANFDTVVLPCDIVDDAASNVRDRDGGEASCLPDTEHDMILQSLMERVPSKYDLDTAQDAAANVLREFAITERPRGTN